MEMATGVAMQMEMEMMMGVEMVMEMVMIALGVMLLLSSNIGVSKTDVVGIAGAPDLHLEPQKTVDFGCINLGSSKSETVMLVNSGELDTKFQVRISGIRVQMVTAVVMGMGMATWCCGSQWYGNGGWGWCEWR